MAISKITSASLTDGVDVSFNAGSAAAPSISPAGDTNTGIFFPAADTIAFAEGGVEAMRIDSSGRVGIGTSSPASFSAKLVVNNGTNKNTTVRGSIRLSGSTIQSIQDNAATDSPLEIYTGSAQLQLEGNPITFYNGGERARIDSSGNLLVGTTSTIGGATGVLQVKGAASQNAMQVQIGTNGNNGILWYNATGSAIGSIVVNSSSVAYNTASDYRLKESVQPMTGALSKVDALKPCTYNWKADGSAGEGFIAHELQAVCPDAVSGEKDAVDADGNPVYQGIDTSFLVATLTAAIQELKAINDAQASRIETLEAKVAALEEQ